MSREPKTTVFEVAARLGEQIGKVVESGTYRTFSVDALPESISLPESYLGKCVGFTIAVTGQEGSDGCDWVGIFAHRLDHKKSDGSPVIDIDPLVIGYYRTTQSVAPTGMMWHHASFDGRTQPASGEIPGADAQSTIEELRKLQPAAASGEVADNATIRQGLEKAVTLSRDLYGPPQPRADVARSSGKPNPRGYAPSPRNPRARRR